MTPEPLPALVALLPVIYFSHFAHELGHALMAWGCGFRVGSFGLGLARPFWVKTWWGAQVFLCRSRPFQGITFFVFPRIFPARLRLAGVLAGGVFFNALVAVAALGLLEFCPWGKSGWMVAVCYNGLIAIVNLLPFRFRIGSLLWQSDGALMIQVLRRGYLTWSAPHLIQQTTDLRHLWQSIRDFSTLSMHLYQSANAWSDLGEFEQAEQLCKEAESLPLEHSRFSRAYGALLRGIIASNRGKFEESGQALAEAQQGFQLLNDEAGLFLVEVERAGRLFHQGNAAEARTLLGSLLSHPGLATHRVLHNTLAEARLCVCSPTTPTTEVEELREEYEILSGKQPSMSRDLRVYSALARLYARQENWERAEWAYQRALKAAIGLDQEFTTAPARERFRLAQAGLLTEARTCLLQRGKSEEAGRLDSLFPSWEEAQRRATEAQEKRTRRALRLGMVIVVINLVCVLVLLTASPLKEIGPLRGSLVAALGIYCCLGGLYGAFYGIIGRKIAACRRSKGTVILLLALLPWLSWSVAALLVRWAPTPL
jgi:tetratricopeptide (TPR) repeat protein